jgi:hypothetical protein
MWCRYPLCAVLILFAAPLCAQSPFEGKTIVAVHVSGLDHIDEKVVMDQIVSVPGTAYRHAEADQDIVRLDRLGVFGAISLTPVGVADGVRVDVELFARGGLAVLGKIERLNYNVWHRRPTLAKWEKGALLAGAVWRHWRAKVWPDRRPAAEVR